MGQNRLHRKNALRLLKRPDDLLALQWYMLVYTFSILFVSLLLRAVPPPQKIELERFEYILIAE